MATADDITHGTARFRPRARLLKALGDELISSPYVAIVELVKNSYDADATLVTIRIRPDLDLVEVLDDGVGMDRATFFGPWMEPATGSRAARGTPGRSRRFRRRFLGAKGIGRFAAARLGAELTLTSRVAGTPTELVAHVNWGAFTDDASFLDEIEIDWAEREASTIVALPTDGPVHEDSSRSGTSIRISALTSDWGTPELRELRRQLARLLPPVGFPDQQDFQIVIEAPPRLPELSGLVSPPELLDRPHYRLSATIGSNGAFDTEFEIRGSHFREAGQLAIDAASAGPGPLNIEIRAWDRGQDDLRELGVGRLSVAAVRDILDEYSGMAIYRDGFRVLPYGEPGDDWLGLDKRRFLNPTARLSNNQILGWVFITASDNPLLLDQSNREGLIRNRAFADLEGIVTGILASLETRRQIWRSEQRRLGPPSVRVVSSLPDFGALASIARDRYPQDRLLARTINQQRELVERTTTGARDAIARYSRLATLGTLIDHVLHDLRTYATRIRQHLEGASAQIATDDQGLSESVSSALVATRELQAVIRRLEPLGGRSRGRPAEVDLAALVRDTTEIFSKDIASLGIQVELPQGAFPTHVVREDLTAVVTNLVDNSIFWLRRVPAGERRLTIALRRVSANEVWLVVSDSGPGVPVGQEQAIFEPYFSAKPDGTGLGLTIAGEILDSYYDGALSLEDPELGGATFRATIRRRT